MIFFNAAFGEIPYGGLVVFNVPLEIPRAQLYVLRDWNGLHRVPFKAVSGDFVAPRADFLHAPDLPVGNVVEGGEHALGAALGDKFERNLVAVAVPSESGF